MRHILTCISIILFFHAYGQDYQINLQYWGIKDGLSDRQVNGIFKDSRGFIWACTKNGLNCFDGYRFKVYTQEKDGLPFNYIWRLVEDADGKFWVMGSDKYDSDDLFIFDPLTHKVESFRQKTGYKQPAYINFIQKMNDSTLFFGYRTKDFFFTWHPRLGLHIYSYPVKAVQFIAITDSNTFWVQNNSSELCEIDLLGHLVRKLKTEHIVSQTEAIYGIVSPYRPNTHYKNALVTLAGIKIDHENGTIINNESDVFNTGIDGIVYDHGKLIHPIKGLLVDHANEGYPDLKLRTVHVITDNNGQVLLATSYGLYMIHISRNRFRKYFFEDLKSFTQNSYRNLVANDGKLFALNEVTGIRQTYLDTNNRKKIADIPHLPPGNMAMIRTREGDLLGLKLNYFYFLEKNSNKWLAMPVTDGMKGVNNVWSIYQLTSDSFLLGTNTGLRIYSKIKNEVYPYNQYNIYYELKNSMVLNISDDRNGQTWLCTSTGFYSLSHTDGITARYSSYDKGSNFLPAKEFQHYYLDTNGVFWLATTKGLIKWNKHQNIYHLTTRKEGLSNNNIYEVYEDNFGRLWMGSDYGLMRYNKINGNVKTYLIDNGITYNEFNRVSHTKDSDGNLYFGTLDGVTAFNPKDFPEEDEQSPVLSVFTYEQFNGNTNRIEDKTADLLHSQTITLNPGDRFFNINYSLLSFKDAIHNTYFWKIDGIDSGWNSNNDQQLRISGLPYGTMMLHIKALAGDGTWSRNELNFTINVIRPVYMRNWFIITTILFLVAGFISFYRFRIYSFKNENERLDKIVKEKTSALEETIKQLEHSSEQKDILMKEIHHRVKNNLQVINVLLNLQLAGIKDEDAKLSIEEGITRISSIALIHHQLYQGDNIAAIELSSFTRELLNQIASVYKQNHQIINLENEIQETWLDIDTAIPLGLILNELMTNSFKYAYKDTGNCQMKISLDKSAYSYTLSYRDYGPGLPDNYNLNKAGSLGMVIIRNLTKQLAGSFTYNNSDNLFIIIFKDTKARKKEA